MKRALIVLLMSLPAMAQEKPSVQMCQQHYTDFVAPSSHAFGLVRQGMSWREMVDAGQTLTACMMEYPNLWTNERRDKAHLAVNLFNADAMQRMYVFMTEHNMAGQFNKEDHDQHKP